MTTHTPVLTGPMPEMNWIEHQTAEWLAQMQLGGNKTLKDFGLDKATNPAQNLAACYLDLLHNRTGEELKQCIRELLTHLKTNFKDDSSCWVKQAEELIS